MWGEGGNSSAAEPTSNGKEKGSVASPFLVGEFPNREAFSGSEKGEFE